MTRSVIAALCLLATGVPALAGDPLKSANYREHISGPTLEPGSLEGKVVFLEYFGYR